MQINLGFIVAFGGRMRNFLFILIFLLILINGCDKNDSDDLSFHFKVIVHDVDGNPVPDLPIGVYNILSGGGNGNGDKGNTTISFNVKEGETAILTIINIDDNILFQSEFEPGFYNYNWPSDVDELFGGTNVYRVKLESASYSATQFAVEQHFSLTYNQIGFTNSDGIFETNDKRYFPNFYYEGMDFDFIDEFGELLSTYQITNTIVIDFPDREYEREVTLGENTFTLIYDGEE